MFAQMTMGVIWTGTTGNVVGNLDHVDISSQTEYDKGSFQHGSAVC